jgi:hypothetical protein
MNGFIWSENSSVEIECHCYLRVIYRMGTSLRRSTASGVSMASFAVLERRSDSAHNQMKVQVSNRYVVTAPIPPTLHPSMDEIHSPHSVRTPRYVCPPWGVLYWKAQQLLVEPPVRCAEYDDGFTCLNFLQQAR